MDLVDLIQTGSWDLLSYHERGLTTVKLIRPVTALGNGGFVICPRPQTRLGRLLLRLAR